MKANKKMIEKILFFFLPNIILVKEKSFWKKRRKKTTTKATISPFWLFDRLFAFWYKRRSVFALSSMYSMYSQYIKIPQCIYLALGLPVNSVRKSTKSFIYRDKWLWRSLFTVTAFYSSMLGGLPLRSDLESLVSFFPRKHANAIDNTMCVCQQFNSIQIYDGKLDLFSFFYEITKKDDMTIPNGFT